MLRIPDDVIGHFAGIPGGSGQNAQSGERVSVKTDAQAAFLALFVPEDTTAVSLTERYALAVFFTLLHGERRLATFYAEGLASENASETMQAAILEAARASRDAAPGPHLSGPLSAGDIPGSAFTVPHNARTGLGPRLTSAFSYTHMRILHPRGCDTSAHLPAMHDAGWTEDGIALVTQLVTFLTAQLRQIHELRGTARARNAS